MTQIRQLIAKLQSFIIDRRSAPRFKFHVPIKIIIPTEKNPNAKLLQSPQELWTSGFTKDLSEAGIAFYVSSIRLHEYYLVGEERPLTAKLELPEGEVTMNIVGVRYEREPGNFIELRYLIGARVTQMNSADREVYQRFLRGTVVSGKDAIQDFSGDVPES